MPIIARAMQHSYDGDPIVARGVENQLVVDWKKAPAGGEVGAALAQVYECHGLMIGTFVNWKSEVFRVTSVRL